MQQSSSCMPSGVFLVWQSDEVEWKKVVSNTVYAHTLVGTGRVIQWLPLAGLYKS